MASAIACRFASWLPHDPMSNLIYLNRKMAPGQLVFGDVSARTENNLCTVTGMAYVAQQGSRRPGETSGGAKYFGGKVVDGLSALRLTHPGMPNFNDAFSEFFFINAESNRIARGFLNTTSTTENTEPGVLPQQTQAGPIPIEIYEVAFSAVSAAIEPKMDRLNVSLTETVSKRRFSDSYVKRTGPQNTLVTAQISFDYNVVEYQVSLHFSSRFADTSAEKIMQRLRSSYEASLLDDPLTNRVFQNYKNVNGYSLGADAPWKSSPTIFKKTESYTVENVAGQVNKLSATFSGQYQLEDA